MATSPPTGCKNWYVPLTESYYKSYKGAPLKPCGPPPTTQYYIPKYLPPDSNDYPPVCMTQEELNRENAQICNGTEPYTEFFEEPKKASKNCTCNCNNFIESETGYRQATKCVCAPYKSSHIHFVT